MIQISDKTKCCGCTACVSCCPKKCISMQYDEEGFLYPVVDIEACVNCGGCEKVCPITENNINNEFDREGFVLRARDLKNVKESTSGGIFQPLAEWIFENDGIICAAGYNNDFTVAHKIVDSECITLEDALNTYKFKGSKYVQSDMRHIFPKLKKKIESNRPVCFIGTTCQVAALKNYMKRAYSNLYTVDLVCHGTPSPILWKKYLEFQQEKHKSNVVDVSFRSKVYGYHSGGMMQITFANGKTYCASARVDLMLKSFFKEIASRPICYECPFKQVERNSDLTVYDCWHFSEIVDGKSDDDNGYTNVIVQSEKGKQLLLEIENKIKLYHVDLYKAIKLDGVMIQKSAMPHCKRNEFYVNCQSKTISEMVNSFIPVKKKDYIVEMVKQCLYKIGVLQKIKNKNFK